MNPNQPQQPPVNPANGAPMPVEPQQVPAGGLPQQGAAAPTPQDTQLDGIGAQHQHVATPPAPAYQGPSPERIDALKKNLAYLWQESIELTGLPVDVLLAQVITNAANEALPANGAMVNFGNGAQLAPDRASMTLWLDSYFRRVMASTPGTNNMPEA